MTIFDHMSATERHLYDLPAEDLIGVCSAVPGALDRELREFWHAAHAMLAYRAPFEPVLAQAADRAGWIV